MGTILYPLIILVLVDESMKNKDIVNKQTNELLNNNNILPYRHRMEHYTFSGWQLQEGTNAVKELWSMTCIWPNIS